LQLEQPNCIAYHDSVFQVARNRDNSGLTLPRECNPCRLFFCENKHGSFELYVRKKDRDNFRHWKKSTALVESRAGGMMVDGGRGKANVKVCPPLLCKMQKVFMAMALNGAF
jgi:hypothetical protein